VRTVPLKHLSMLPLVNGLGEPGEAGESGWPRYVRTTDIGGPRELRRDVFASLPPALARKAPLNKGDIVMTAAGATVGKSLLYLDDSPACFAGYLVRCRPRTAVDARFLSHWTQSDHYWLQIDSGAVRSTIDNFSASKYRSLLVPWPSADMRQRIADFLDDQVARLDAALAEVRALVHTAELQRTSRLAEAYEDLPSADLLEGRTPTPVVSIRGLTARMLSGGTPATSDPSYWDDEGLPWIAIGDMVDGGTTQATQKGLSPAGLAAARLRPAPPGTVLFAMYASVGKTTVTGVAAAWNQAILGLVPRPDVDPDYLLGWLELARPSLPAIARSATQDNLNADQVARLRVPRRTPAQQRRIGMVRRGAVGDHAQLLAEADRFQQLLEERKRALITACVTGEFDVSTASARAGDAALAHLPPGLGAGSANRALR
jgi:type I restriction enzyme S subunit